jgi:hypothetical protein
MAQHFPSRVRRACALVAAGLASVLGTVPAGATTPGPATTIAAQAHAQAQAATPRLPGGYWLVAADGGIFGFGGVPFQGSAGGIHIAAPVVGMAPTPSGRGYWMVGSNGTVYNFGDAKNMGAPPLPPSNKAVAIAGTPDGQGYLIATAGGPVYAYGDAPAGTAQPLVAPVVGMAMTADGHGYWLVTGAGGVYSYGSARFFGSAGNIRLNKPIVGMASTPDGGGYWLVATDGGMFSFGDAAFYGSTGNIRLNKPIVGMTPTSDGRGYWLVASDGGIFTFGDAPFRGSTGALTLNQPIVGMARGRVADPYTPRTTGYDVSFPQCGSALPAPPWAFGIVGINNGKAFTHDPCLTTLRGWAGPGLSVYMNLNSPPTGSSQALSGPAGQCRGNDTGCMAYNYGYNAAVDAFNFASASGVTAPVWWLDIETANTWDPNTNNNDLTIQGALDALTTEGVEPGIYSTSYQWGVIAGHYNPATPIWVATGADYATAVAYCSAAHGFGGGVTWLTQYGTAGNEFDQDYACPIP